jgi:hypothetical protein
MAARMNHSSYVNRHGHEDLGDERHENQEDGSS